MIRLYTDGSCRDTDDGPVVGWAWVLVDDGNYIMYESHGTCGFFRESRNVAGEIWAISCGLTMCRELGLHNIDIYHDYIGLEKWYTEEWEAKVELTRRYVERMRELVPDVFPIHFHHVKAHSGDKWNEYVDRLAKEAIGLLDQRRTDISEVRV